MTTAYLFSLIEDRITPGGSLQLVTGGAARVVFCLQGSAGTDEGTKVEANACIFQQGNSRFETGYDGATLWRWELREAEILREEDSFGSTSRLLLEETIEIEEGEDYEFHVSGLRFAAGAATQAHVCKGPTLAACYTGTILREKGSVRAEYKTEQPWIEKGQASVTLSLVDETPAGLIRVCLLKDEQIGSQPYIITGGLESDGSTQVPLTPMDHFYGRAIIAL